MTYISRSPLIASLVAILGIAALGQAPSIPLPDGPFTFDV
jgi:hypothetical protein